MLDRLLELRRRLDRLGADAAGAPRLADRWARAVGRGAPPEPRELLAVDRGLDRAGVHTLADARLLARLMREPGGGPAPLRGLARRARGALAEVERHLAHEERQARLRGAPSAAARARLEGLWARLARAVKVAAVLAGEEPEREELCRLLPRAAADEGPPQSPRVAAVEYLVGRARASALDQGHKRRALDQAHELLLRIGSELERDRERVRRLRAEVARARPEARAGGADPVARLSGACARGEGGAAWSAALGLYRDAVAARDAGLAGAAREVLERLEEGIAGGVAEAVRCDRASELLDAVGEEGAIAAQLEARYGARACDALAELALDLESEEWSVFDLAVGAGRFFDSEEEGGEEVGVESPLAAPARLERVPYPGPVQTMDLAQSLRELRHFVITDPRLVLYDLASQRQLAHAWYAPEGGGESLTRKRGTGAVRVYVCDASGSMAGARARFRDAVLVAELNNLSVREARGLPVVPVYYSFFTDHPTALERVEGGEGALRVVSALLRESPAEGRTDITYALESAFAAIRDARGRDADLERATVVLVTDGEDRVDLARLWAAKAPVGEIEITLNFVSLGRENPDLRQLVLEQRGAGRRAFYYHLGDEELAGGRELFDSGLRTLLPARPEVELAPDDPRVRAAVAALAELAGARRAPGAVEVSPELRWGAYFTAPPAPPGQAPPPRDLDLACDLLEAVAETVALAPAEARAAEAVRLLEHLLEVYGVGAARFARARSALPSRGAEALERIRLLGAPSAPDAGGVAWG